MARQGVIGCAAIGVLIAGAVVALFAWGGVHVVTAPPATKPVRVAGPVSAVQIPAGALLTVPVARVARASIADSWGDPRDNGKRLHHGTDIMAPQGTPVIAAATGFVEKLFQSAAGGTTLYVRSPDRRVVYYYAHLSGYAPGIVEGLAVKAGDPLGYVGDTGNAGAGNYHLHFGVSLTTPEQKWYQGKDVDPYPLLAGKPAPR